MKLKMLYSRVVSVAILLAKVSAHVNSRAVALQSPACATKCTVTNLEIAQCQLTDVKKCLCTNATLQLDLSLCVQQTCNLTEQATAANILQDELCAGVPQPSRSSYIIQTTVIITAFTYIIFALRCISRYIVTRRVWWDDAFLIAAVIVTIPMTIIPIYNASKGFGKHFWDIPPENLRILRLLYYVSQTLYAFVQPATKISILLLYLRIFPSDGFRIALIISLVWMSCHFIAFEIEIALQCLPVNSIWNMSVTGKCTNFIVSIYAGAALSIFEDVVIVTLPIFVLKDLSLSTRKKIALILMFALGSACVTSMIRLRYIAEFSHSADVTWDDVDLVIWSIVEVYTAIICASLVSIRPLVAKLLPSLFPTTNAIATLDSRAQPNSRTPGWPVKVGSMLSGKLRSNQGSQLLSENDLPFDGTNKVVLKVSVKEGESDIELSGR